MINSFAKISTIINIIYYRFSTKLLSDLSNFFYIIRNRNSISTLHSSIVQVNSMSPALKSVVVVSLFSLLTSCGDLDTVGDVTFTQPQSTITPEKPASHSLDSTVVCCFCGMLDA